MTKQYLLGIDIGTSACKVALFGKDGKVEAAVSEGYPVYYPHPGWAEQNPDEWWEAVCKAIWTVISSSGVSPDDIALTDRAGLPLQSMKKLRNTSCRRSWSREATEKRSDSVKLLYCLRVISREVFCHIYGKIPRHTGKNAITEGDLECILTKLL